MNQNKYRLGFHLMPPSGWMNDPNGLCYYKGFYHVFFQYAPKDPNGKVRYWGHYISKDLLTWEYVGIAIKSDHQWDRSGAFSGCGFTEEPFGYMWECPDAFTLGGKTILMCCPQGVPRNELRFQNIHQSGYFILEDREKEHINGFCNPDTFVPWDYGHDFYAPQTMQDAKGRTLLIGWAGMPGMDSEYTNQPIVEEGWQHSLTVPRVLTMENGVVHQNPVEELKSLRREQIHFIQYEGNIRYKLAYETWDMEVEFNKDKNKKEICLNEEVSLCWEDGIFSMAFEGDCACGRQKRKISVEFLEDIRILKDVSMFEIYLNHGEFVLTDRYFPQETRWTLVQIQGAKDASVWDLRKMDIYYNVSEEE